MNLVLWLVNHVIKALTRIVCVVDDSELSKVPVCGPLILISNHINFIDVPLLYTHLMPRPITGLAKAETWKIRWIAALFNLWGGIPLRRGEADTSAIRKSLAALSQNKIVGISPEGTRSGHGRLQRGHPGVITLALHGGAAVDSPIPILPIAFWGVEDLSANLKRLRRTPVHIRVGQPFYLNTNGQNVNRTIRQLMVDEIMGQIALLMPEKYRGVYSDLSNPVQYLTFQDCNKSL